MNRNKKIPIIVWLVLAIPIFYCGMLIGQHYQADMGLSEIMDMVNNAFAHPFAISYSRSGLKFAMAFVSIYAVGILYYHANKQNTRKGEEHGSARWASIPHVNAVYKDKSNRMTFKELLKPKTKQKEKTTEKKKPNDQSKDMNQKTFVFL